MNEEQLVHTLLQGSAAVMAIGIGFVGIVYAVYAQFALPGRSGRRLPVLRPLRQIAWAFLALTALSSVIAALCLWWLAEPKSQLYDAVRFLFLLEVLIVPIAGASFIWRLFR